MADILTRPSTKQQAAGTLFRDNKSNIWQQDNNNHSKIFANFEKIVLVAHLLHRFPLLIHHPSTISRSAEGADALAKFLFDRMFEVRAFRDQVLRIHNKHQSLTFLLRHFHSSIALPDRVISFFWSDF
jgi:hypothetical protein